MFPGTVMWWAKINKPHLEETVRKLGLTWDDIVPVLHSLNTTEEFFDCFDKPEVVFKSLLEKNNANDEGTRKSTEEEHGHTKLTFATHGHVRRLSGCALERDFVYDTLRFHGYDVQKTTHKSHVPYQSDERWEVKGAFFEVHLGYKNNKKGPLTDTIIQGLKGWSAQKLDHLALVLTDAYDRSADANATVDPEFWWDEFPEEAEVKIASIKKRRLE
jgi:hypothetical protein